ncbi:MAG: D-inositol-3-phosphate glycosyltransferase [Verrucomicrobiae bacterium]|nr:D-inositol-3-phosphate glycosyltransferase [Verrucomicrobiae bacterium]
MTARCFFIGTTLADNPVPHHFTALANELVRRGHRVVIVAPHRVVELENHTSNPAIYVWPSPRPTKLADALFLRRLIREYRPDCLIANFVAVNWMMFVGKWMGVRQRVAWYHTLSTQIQIDNPAPAWKRWLLWHRKALVYRAATQIVPVSAAARADVARLHPRFAAKCRVILNAINDPGVNAVVPATDRLVCAARFERSKGQDVLIRALGLLREQQPTVRVEFIGSGPAQAACEELARAEKIADRCAFLGRVPHGEVLRHMAGATATVLPSRSDNCPLVTIESLAVGTPVLGSRVGGIPEVVRDGVDGFLVPPDDPAALAAKLDGLLSDPALQRQLRVNSRAGYCERFDLQKAVPPQADWLEELTR